MPATPNVVLFGGSGSGKSSIINMLAERPVAAVSSSVYGCTFTSARYAVDIMGSPYNIYDTAGLDEGNTGTVPKTEAIVQLFRLLKNLDTGVNLLVFVMRGPRIKDAAYKNWRLFSEIVCRGQVPVVIAITGLENEPVMDEWWGRNQDAFRQCGIYPRGVGCITASKGPSRAYGHVFEDEYEESKQKMRMLMKHRLEYPWKVQAVEWFSSIVHVTYESRACRKAKEHRTVETVVGPGIKELVERCEMTAEEAKELGNRLLHVT